MKRRLFPIALAIPLALASCGSSDAKEARDLCEQDTIARSKYPAAAEVMISETEDMKGENKIVVSGHADFANGFGTPVRHTFFCSVSTSGKKLKVTDNIVMEGGWLKSDLAN